MTIREGSWKTGKRGLKKSFRESTNEVAGKREQTLSYFINRLVEERFVMAEVSAV